MFGVVLLAGVQVLVQVKPLDLQREIDRTAETGGGVVSVAAGDWEAKPFVLRSGVTLRLGKGATVYASTNAADYAARPGEKAFVYAEGAENVAVEGQGVICGRGWAFREMEGLRGESQPQMLPVLMRFSRCRNLRIEGITYRDGAAWGCHLRNCDGVVVRGVTANNHVNHTNDGLDIESRNVLVEDCSFDADDDALCFKSESDPSFPVENVEVRNCRMASCCNAIKFGTGSYGDFRNIRIHDCTLVRATGNHCFSWWKVMPGVKEGISGLSALALEVVDGGRMENVRIRNIDIVEGYHNPVFIRLGRRHLPAAGRETYLRDVVIENVRGAAESLFACPIAGVPGARIENVTLRNIDLAFPGGDTKKWRGRGIPENEDGYPKHYMWDYNPLPAWGFYVRHADGIRFENVRIGLKSADARVPVLSEDSGISGRVVCSGPDGDVTFALTPFAGGQRYTCEKLALKGTNACTFALSPACRKYWGWRANILSDDREAVALRTYSPASPMHVSRTEISATVREGESFGYASGPREGFMKRLQAMTLDAGAPHSKGGGAWSLESELCRRSYLHAVAPTRENLDAFIALCERAGFGTLHLREGWYEAFGHYNVNRTAFPDGREDLRRAVEKIHAAGLKAGFHTLTACIDPKDAWLKTDDITNLLAWTTYTLAAPLTSASTELVVNEPPIAKHDVVFTYSGNGNAIRLGREIVQYTGVRREKPYAFTGLTRGAWGTPVSDHAAGERADYLQQRYLAFYPAPDSPLLGKVADAVADVFNSCGFDQVYCDGAEGMMTSYGLNRARRAIAERLKADEIVNEGAMGYGNNNGYDAQSWWFHSRVGNLDVPHWAPKRFHDIHLDGSSLAECLANFLVPQFGWWAPKLSDFHSRSFYVDEMEYYAAKNAAHDLVASMIGRPELASDPMPYHAARLLTVFGWYEHARLVRAFTPEALAALKVPREDYALRQSEKDGRWYLQKVREADVRRVEAPFGAAPYDSPRAKAILTAADVPALAVTAAAKPRVTARVASGRDAAHGETVVLSAANGGKERRGAWACASRRFAGPAYFNGAVAPGPTNVALAVWIRGDGSGALLNVQLENPREHGLAYQEHYVDLGFTGWRYFEFPFRENDAARWADYVWPYRDWLGIFHRTVFRGRIGAVNLYLNEIPAGGKAEVAVGEMRVVPIASRVLPAGVCPFDLVSGEFAELDAHGAWTKYDIDGEPLRRKTTGERPDVMLDKPIPAFTEDGVRRIRYEAMMPQLWDPASGFNRLDPVVVRPGERAAVEVKVFGDAAAKISVGGVTHTGSGSFGVLSGILPVRVASAAPVRLEFVKRYKED